MKMVSFISQLLNFAPKLAPLVSNMLKTEQTTVSAETAQYRTDPITQILKNAFWLSSSYILARAFNLARSIILARLLLPEDFGLFGLANTILGFTAIFGNVGVGMFVVYKCNISEEYKDNAFWLNLAIASLLMIGVIALSPFVSAIYSRWELVWVLSVLAVAFWLQTVGLVHKNLMYRERQFRSLAVVDVLVSIVLLSTAAGLAWWGYGVWALVFSILIANMLNLSLLWHLSGYSPRWRLCWHTVKEIGAFSGWYLAATVVCYTALSTDKLLVGKFLGAKVLGLYVFAYDLSLALAGVSVSPLWQVTIPELAHLRYDPARFWSTYVKISRLAVSIMCPIAYAVIVAAPDILPGIFGAKWGGAVVPFLILSLYTLSRSVLGDPFASLGRFDLSFKVGLGAIVFGCSGILIGLRHGITGVALAVSLVGIGVTIFALYITAPKRVIIEIFQHSAPHVLVAGVIALPALYVRRLFIGIAPDYMITIVGVLTTIGVIIYGIVFWRQIKHFLFRLKDRCPQALLEV